MLGPGPLGLLRLVLIVLAVDATVKTFLILTGRRGFLLRVFPRLPESEITSFALVVWKGHGAAVAAIALMLWLAARDPGRHDAVIYGMILGLIVAAALEVASLYTLGARRFVSSSVTWAHAFARLGVAGLLAYLLPAARVS